MGKKDYSDEEIKIYMESGWNFRIKKVHGKTYITRRKGQKERSMGPYKEKLWVRIQNLVSKRPSQLRPKTIRTLSEFNHLYNKFEEQIETLRGFKVVNTCLFIDKEKYCTLYRYAERPGYFKIGDKLLNTMSNKLKEFSNEGVKEHLWVHKANALYCKNCNAYISNEMKKKILI